MSDTLGFRITAEGCAWVCDGCGKEFPSGGTLHLCDAKLPEEYARLRANIATLESDLAASREREARSERQAEIATLEWERATEREAALSAVLERLRANALEMAGYVKSYGLDDHGPQSEWSRYSQCRSNIENVCDYRTILAAHDAEIARKAKVEALEDAQKMWRSFRMEPDAPGYFPGDAMAKYLKICIAALQAERGKG